MTPADILEAAAQRIERDGWCRRRTHRGKHHCVMGALADGSVDGDYNAAVRAVSAEAVAHGAFSVANWNDTVCRNGREAAAFIRAAKERV